MVVDMDPGAGNAFVFFAYRVYDENRKLGEAVHQVSEQNRNVRDSLAEVTLGLIDSVRTFSVQKETDAKSRISTVEPQGAAISGVPSSGIANIKKEIRHYIASQYEKNIYPLTNNWDRSTGEIPSDYDQRIHAAMEVTISTCQSYGRQLSARYPAQAEEIERYTAEQINIYQGLAGTRMEEAYKKWRINHGYED